MRTDYREFHDLAHITALDLGLVRVHDSDFISEFYLKNGWTLALEGERHSHGLMLYATPPEGNGRFSIWILMRAFEHINKTKLGAPTLSAQLDFIKKEKLFIFNETDNYSSIYNKINNLQDKFV